MPDTQRIAALVMAAVAMLWVVAPKAHAEIKDEVDDPARVAFHNCQDITVKMPKARRPARWIARGLYQISLWTGLKFTRRWAPGNGVLTIKRKKALSHPSVDRPIAGLSYYPQGKEALVEVARGIKGERLSLLTIHEVGHTLGLVHGGDGIMQPTLHWGIRATKSDVQRFTQVMALCKARHG